MCRWVVCAPSALAVLVLILPVTAALAGDAKAPVRKPYGIEKRVLWTTSNIHGTPDPAPPYRTQVAYPNLPRFAEPLELTTAPDVSRFFVSERLGKLFSFPLDRQTDQADLMLDVGRTVYGLALHPRFKENGYFYVVYVLDPKATEPHGTRLVRFTATFDEQGVPRADKSSETLILEWPSGGHNGGCTHFGPDGYLYIVTGDGSGIADELQTGQDVTDLLASMLRIDVDHPEGGRPYGVPKDNPLVGVAGARPEIYAFGLRQFWKFSFDRASGGLWGGDVGQDLWEMIYRIRPGGNYGWSVREGTHPFRPERPKGPTPILDPVVEHSHTLFRSITGGHVYHGTRLAALEGQYLYGDYDTGKVWCFRWDGQRAVDSRELADSTLRIIDWGESPDGELYLLDFISGRLHWLVPTPPLATQPAFPRLLSETGLFTSTADLTPAPGLIPYEVNAPLWSDGAEKERYLAIPGDGQIVYNGIEYPQPAPGAPRGWRFPDGTVVVKTFSLDMEQGNPASRRRLETRILHFEQLAGNEEIGDQVWRGYTYVWNDEQTDAELLKADGETREYRVQDAAALGGWRVHAHRFPSRAECTLCHTMPAKFLLGVNTLQMNRDFDYGGVVANQLSTLEHLGLFTEPLPERPENLPRLVDYRDQSQALDARARSYLHSNCAHCHMKWGGGNAEFQLLATLELADTGAVLTRPGQGAFGIDDPRIIVPGQPERSLVYRRMILRGLGQMPHIASNLVDEQGAEVIRQWLAGMKAAAAGGGGE